MVWHELRAVKQHSSLVRKKVTRVCRLTSMTVNDLNTVVDAKRAL